MRACIAGSERIAQQRVCFRPSPHSHHSVDALRPLYLTQRMILAGTPAVHLECYARPSSHPLAERISALARGDLLRQACRDIEGGGRIKLSVDHTLGIVEFFDLDRHTRPGGAQACLTRSATSSKGCLWPHESASHPSGISSLGRIEGRIVRAATSAY